MARMTQAQAIAKFTKQTGYKVSDVIHRAADHYLCHNGEFNVRAKDKHWVHFSCCAIDTTIGRIYKENDLMPWYSERDLVEQAIKTGLRKMGCPVGSTDAFRQFQVKRANGFGYDNTPESQSARYIWLKLAALVAEEQENAT